MNPPDLLVPVAIWEFLTALGMLMVIAAMLIALVFLPAWTIIDGGWDFPRVENLAVILIAVIAPVFLVYLILAVMSGVLLLQGREVGRIMSIVHAALSLLCVPFGTVIGSLVLVYLTRAEVKSYFES